LSRDHGKAFDLKAFANGFGEAFDIRGFARGLCSAFDLRNAAKLFVAGFRDGADLIRRQLHGATALVRLDGRDRHVDGLLLLQRLLADMAGGGGAAAKALREIRYLMRPYNPRVDAIPDGQLPSLVKRIIDDLQKPAARAEDFTGAVGRALAEAQAKAAELAFAEAAQVLDAALAQTGAEDQERARGRAALLAERGWIARLQLRYREAAEFYEQAAKAVAFDALTAWEYVLEAAGAYYAQGDEFGDNGALIEAIALYRSALKGASRVRVPLQWAMVQNNLGNALGMLGDRESGTTRLEEAVKAFRGALKEYTRERVPFDWAMTLNNLGNALAMLGDRDRERGTMRLEEAAAAYSEALKEYTRERVPLDWAMTQNNLGNALLALGERERGTTRLKEAVAASHAALTEWRRERAPLDWAGTQNNLGIALTRLGEREPGTARLEFAVAAYRAALTEWTRERVPLRWATTQNNLGATLETLGERESGMARRARLEGAITSYNDALALFVKGGAERQAGMCRANRDRVLQLLQAE
jgi:tetratricopeptide (TPR) repeat protein